MLNYVHITIRLRKLPYYIWSKDQDIFKDFKLLVLQLMEISGRIGFSVL